MQLAKIIGRATATVKHPSMQGWRLLLAQPFGVAGKPDGAPQLVLDQQGARKGDTVIVSADGKAAREMVGTDKTCVRWTVMGIVDE